MIEVVPFRAPRERAAAAPRLAGHLRADGLIAYPTETVYGLGCALRPAALDALAAIKGDRPFLLLVAGPGMASGLEWEASAKALAGRFWPGPLTLALPDPGRAFPARVRGPGRTVAVRQSPHPGVADILRAAGGPVTSTSANRPGEPPARSGAEAARALERAGAHLGQAGVLVLDGGELPPGPPSTIVRCGRGVRLLREGAVSREEIQAVVDLR